MWSDAVEVSIFAEKMKIEALSAETCRRVLDKSMACWLEALYTFRNEYEAIGTSYIERPRVAEGFFATLKIEISSDFWVESRTFIRRFGTIQPTRRRSQAFINH